MVLWSTLGRTVVERGRQTYSMADGSGLALAWELLMAAAAAGAMGSAAAESCSGPRLSRHPNRMMRFPLSRQNSRVGYNL